MNKTAIIYSFNTKKTGKVAELIKEAFDSDMVEMVNAEEINESLFMSFDQIIMGVATWFDGELPNFWDEFVPALEDLDLSGKKIALYGLGDQKGYPENFLG
jgi:flavodoxin I